MSYIGNKNCKACAITMAVITVVCVLVALVLGPPISYILWTFAGLAGSHGLVTTLAVLSNKREE
jgi:hypothetical protein